MKNLYSIIRTGLLATALVSTSALADLSDILSSGKVKIAVPEAFADPRVFQTTNRLQWTSLPNLIWQQRTQHRAAALIGINIEGEINLLSSFAINVFQQWLHLFSGLCL